MMRIGQLTAALAACLLLSGCGKDDTTTASGDTAATTGGTANSGTSAEQTNKLVGTWNQVGEAASTGTATFNSDGTFTLISTDANNAALTVTAKGTYTVESETEMTRTFTEFEVVGASDEQRKTIEEGFDKLKGQPRKGMIEWISDTEIKFTDEDGSPSTWKKT